MRCARSGRQCRAAAVQQDVAERALVGEPQLGTGIGEGEPDPDMWRYGLPRVAEQQLAAHPQMGQQGILGGRSGRVGRERQPQVLATAEGGGDHLAAGSRLEIGPAGQMPPDGARVAHLDRADRPAHDMPLQPPADNFDLR